MSRHLWKNSYFVILLSGQWISQVGNALFLMAVSWYVLSVTHSRSDLGYVMGFVGAAGIVGILSGVFADRWPHRRTLVLTDTIRAVLSLFLVAAFLTHHLSVVVVAGVLFLLNLLGTLFSATESAYLPEVTTAEDYAAANGVNQSSSALSQLAGLGAGGFLLALGGPVLLFLINGCSFVISAASLVFTRPLDARQPEVFRASSIVRDLREGIATVRHSPFLKRFIPVAILINFSATPLSIMDVAWVRQILHRGAVAYGFFGVAILLGMITGSIFSTSLAEKWTFNQAVICGLIVAGAALAALAFFPYFAFNLLCLFVTGVAIGLVNTLVSTKIIVSTAGPLRGRISGLLNALVTVAIPLGAAMVGWASGPLGLPWLFRLSGLLIALLSLGFIGLPESTSLGLPSLRPTDAQ